MSITRRASGTAGTGPEGPPGESAYQVAVDAGFPGTVDQWLASLKGDPGSPGAPGSGGGSVPVTIDTLPLSGIVSAHRGGGDRLIRPIAVENSLSAYWMAAQHGAHILDMDCWLTADAVPILMHDPDVSGSTAGAGLISTYQAHTLPKLTMPGIVGSGWDPEPVPTLPQVLVTFGGKYVMTVEAKSTGLTVGSLATLIKKFGLANSVFINTPSPSTAAQIVAAGCHAHVYGCTTVADVQAAGNAGASLIEVPYNATSDIVVAAQATGARFIAGPINQFSQLAALTPGIQGYVCDAVGYLNRPDQTIRLSNSIGPAVRAQRRGIGWHAVQAGATVENFLAADGLVLTSGAQQMSYEFGDLSGNPTTTGSVALKLKYTTLPSDTTQAGYVRLMSTVENAAPDLRGGGYIVSLAPNGALQLTSGLAGSAGGTSLGSASSPTLVAGTEYTVLFEWSASQVRVTRVDTGTTTGWVNSTSWRGRYFYATGAPLTSGRCLLTDLTIA